MVTILLVEDHSIVRQGLRMLLEAESDFTVVGEAANSQNIDNLIERLRPDVVITDLMLPGLSGLEVIRYTSRRSPKTRVIVLSMHANEDYVLQALRDGASGYVLKESTAADIAHAIREVMQGRQYLSPALAFIDETRLDGGIAPFKTLTNREREVLCLAAKGYSNVEIGTHLYISPRTVEVHRANLMHKLGLRSYVDLVRYALRHDLLPLDN